jgi:hypothetical protein
VRRRPQWAWPAAFCSATPSPACLAVTRPKRQNRQRIRTRRIPKTNCTEEPQEEPHTQEADYDDDGGGADFGDFDMDL